MKRHVSSVESSRRLKKAGYSKPTEYVWLIKDGKEELIRSDLYEDLTILERQGYEVLPALTVVEAMEELPEVVMKKVDYHNVDSEAERYFLEIKKLESEWMIVYQYYYYEPSDDFYVTAKTISDASTDMLSHLYENNLINK